MNLPMDEVLARISACLEDEGLDASHDPTLRCWWVTFEIDGKSKRTMLMHPPDDEYVVAAAEISSSRLHQKRIDELPARILAALLETRPDEGFLARVTYIPNGPVYYATSACSIEEPSGRKLRRRMEACARMAVTLEKALHALADVPPVPRAPKKKARQAPTKRVIKRR